MDPSVQLMPKLLPEALLVAMEVARLFGPEPWALPGGWWRGTTLKQNKLWEKNGNKNTHMKQIYICNCGDVYKPNRISRILCIYLWPVCCWFILFLTFDIVRVAGKSPGKSWRPETNTRRLWEVTCESSNPHFALPSFKYTKNTPSQHVGNTASLMFTNHLFWPGKNIWRNEL